ncbi:hypothetical protein ASPCADRAFT_211947, partial [Aspergillus carbonarius ITEM 5010]
MSIWSSYEVEVDLIYWEVGETESEASVCPSASRAWEVTGGPTTGIRLRQGQKLVRWCQTGAGKTAVRFEDYL